MADIVQVTGFILSSMPVGEYDRRIVILSKELGKISAFAKGARRPNSHLIGVTRPFIFGTFECYRAGILILYSKQRLRTTLRNL